MLYPAFHQKKKKIKLKTKLSLKTLYLPKIPTHSKKIRLRKLPPKHQDFPPPKKLHTQHTRQKSIKHSTTLGSHPKNYIDKTL